MFQKQEHCTITDITPNTYPIQFSYVCLGGPQTQAEVSLLGKRLMHKATTMRRHGDKDEGIR
jgi:hypothetical protein